MRDTFEQDYLGRPNDTPPRASINSTSWSTRPACERRLTHVQGRLSKVKTGTFEIGW